MRPLAPRLVFPLAFLLAVPLSLANSKINGIPNECEMTTYHVAVGPDGKGAKPEKLFSLSLAGTTGLGLVRAFQMSHDGKRVAYHTFAGVAIGEGNAEPQDHKAIVVYK